MKHPRIPTLMPPKKAEPSPAQAAKHGHGVLDEMPDRVETGICARVWDTASGSWVELLLSLSDAQALRDQLSQQIARVLARK